jgi:hypothetical protein
MSIYYDEKRKHSIFKEYKSILYNIKKDMDLSIHSNTRSEKWVKYKIAFSFISEDLKAIINILDIMTENENRKGLLVIDNDLDNSIAYSYLDEESCKLSSNDYHFIEKFLQKKIDSINDIALEHFSELLFKKNAQELIKEFSCKDLDALRF